MTEPIDRGVVGPDGILSSMAREERLARALALGVPAFLRRARSLEALLETFHAGLARERAIRLRRLRALAAILADHPEIVERLPGRARAILRALETEPEDPERRRFPARKARRRPPDPLRAAREIEEAARAFDAAWMEHLARLPLETIRRAQADYNRYYPIERELALPGAPPYFKEVPLLAREDLLRRYPRLEN